MTDPREMIDRYLDDGLTEDQVSTLMAWVTENEENADTFARACLMDQATHQLLADTPAGAPESGPGTRFPLRAVAALLLAGVLAAAFFALRPGAPPPALPIARIDQVIRATTLEGRPITSGTAVEPGPLAIDKGLLRIRFSNGTSIVIEGPARIRVIDALHLVLDHGTLTARVPESAKGFTVDTSSTQIVDRGTAFGIMADRSGRTDVCVFDGRVDVNPLSDAPASDPIPVVEGAAVRVASSGADPESVTYHTEAFERAWPLNSGVLQTTGLMRFVSPGPAFVPGAFEDNQHILVFPERRHVRAPSPIPVDLTEPGEYARLRRTEQHFVEPKSPVRSYLIQFDPVGRLDKKDPNKTAVFGQITFDQPIVGLIASSPKLIQTDAILGHADADYGQMPRGIEPVKPGAPTARTAGRDSVILAADQRTLIVNFAAGSAVDQIRVLVMDAETPEHTP